MATNSEAVRCTKRGHFGSLITKEGFRKDSKGWLWQRFQCTRPTGTPHRFRLLVDDMGVTPPPIDRAPTCPEHPNSRVVRNGTYIKVAPRQKYKCQPIKEPAHYFALDLPRAHVDTASVRCSGCEEFLSVHKGNQAVSRHSMWAMKWVVEALKETSLGVSYSKVSQNVWDKRDRALTHAKVHEESEEVKSSPVKTESISWSSAQGKNSWRIAADLVEQYGPVLHEYVTNTIHARESKQRRINDARKLEGKPVTSPLTFVLDEIPIYVRFAGGPATIAYTIYTVAEVLWKPGRTSSDVMQRDNRLRLARALPGAVSSQGWELVLQELAVVPDVIVADFGWSINSIVKNLYADQEVVTVPSLYHFIIRMRLQCEKTPALHNFNGSNKTVVPEVEAHLRKIGRNELVAMGLSGWGQWWDELELLTLSLGAPVGPIRARRVFYEDPIAKSIQLLISHPQVPASNASIEIKNRLLIKPMLQGRGQRYRNIARTNSLLDLLICQENLLFNDLVLVEKLIRDDNLKFKGWATPQRTFDDKASPILQLDDGNNVGRYASLLDTGLVPALLKSRKQSVDQ